MGIGRLGSDAVPGRRARRRSSTSSARSTPSSTCRSSTACRRRRRRPADDRRGARRAGGARDRRAAAATGHRAAAVADRRRRRARRRRCFCSDDPALLHLGEDQFLERLQSYLDLAPALRERVPDIDYVDLRFDERMYVRPAAAKAVERPRRGSRRTQAGSAGRREERVARKERYLVGLDVGTSKVTAVVGEMLDDGGLDIVGLGVAESRGIRRGVVVNLEAAVDSIKKAIEEAELMAGVEIDSVHLALSGPHIKGFNSRGVIAVAGKNREITREDVRRAIDAAKAVSLPTGREILHVLPQDFVVDEQDGIGAPVGMTGARLEVNVHIVTGSQSVDAEHRRVREPRRRRRSPTPCSSSSRPARRC